MSLWFLIDFLAVISKAQLSCRRISIWGRGFSDCSTRVETVRAEKGGEDIARIWAGRSLKTNKGRTDWKSPSGFRVRANPELPPASWKKFKAEAGMKTGPEMRKDDTENTEGKRQQASDGDSLGTADLHPDHSRRLASVDSTLRRITLLKTQHLWGRQQSIYLY